jgi:hypothetical protein
VKGWAFFSSATMDHYQNVSAVGSLLVGARKQITEAGAIIWNNGQAFIVERGAYNLRSQLRFMRPVDYSSAAALLVRRDSFVSSKVSRLFCLNFSSFFFVWSLQHSF